MIRIDRTALRDRVRRNRRELILQALGAVAGVTHELNQPMTALLSYVRAAELMAEPRHFLMLETWGFAAPALVPVRRYSHNPNWNSGSFTAAGRVESRAGGADPRAVTHTTPRVGSVSPPDGSA